MLLILLACPGWVEACAPYPVLYIPAIGLEETIGLAPLVEGQYQIGDGVQRLDKTTRLDGSPGTIFLAGHAPGVFARVHELAPGDSIVLFTEARVWVFEVTRSWLTSADDDRILHEAPEGWRLVLITCEGDRRRLIEALPAGRVN